MHDNQNNAIAACRADNVSEAQDKQDTPVTADFASINGLSPLEAALRYRELGWAVLPLPPNEKACRRPGWPKVDPDGIDLRAECADPQSNIGIRGDGLVDIDLDCDEAVAMADRFLPPTPAMFGRPSKPVSHRLYVPDGPMKTQRYKADTGDCLVEARYGPGVFAMAPPSMHPCGERVTWRTGAGLPSSVKSAELLQAVERLAGAVLLARHWPKEGSRHDLALHLGGAMARAGWDEEDAVHLIRAVCDQANDEEVDSRVQTVRDCFAQHATGGHLYGVASLGEVLDEKVTGKLCQWLGLKGAAATSRGTAAVAGDQQRVKEVYPDAPASPAARIPDGYWVNDEGHILQAIAGRKQMAATVSLWPLVLSGRWISLDDGNESVELAWHKDGAWHRVRAGREVISNRSQLVSLSTQGVPVTSENARAVVQYLSQYEHANHDLLPPAKMTARLGWHDGEQFVLPDRTVTPSTADPEIPVVGFQAKPEMDHRLLGSLAATGALDKWVECIKALCVYPVPTFLVYASFASVLLKPLEASGFMINLNGTTSTGKTSALKVAASVWGHPLNLPGSWNSSSTARERRLGLLNHLPLIIDDTNQARLREEVEQAPYQLASGQGRGRGTVHGMQQTVTWCNLTISTGEQAIHGMTGNHTDAGNLARTLEIGLKPFGEPSMRTGQFLTNLQSSLAKHHGVAGPRFVQWLMEQNKLGELRERHQAIVDQLKEDLENDGVAMRQADAMAIVQLAGELVHEAFGFEWDVRQIIQPVWQVLCERFGDLDQAAAAMRVAIDYFRTKPTAFPDRGAEHTRYTPHELLGYGSVTEDPWRIAYTPTVLEELLRRSQFNCRTILQIWQDRGWLICDRDRLQKTVRIKGNNERFYAITQAAFDAVGDSLVDDRPHQMRPDDAAASPPHGAIMTAWVGGDGSAPMPSGSEGVLQAARDGSVN